MERFHYELLHTPKGRDTANRVDALVKAHPLLLATSELWAKPIDPTPADLYACLFILTDDIDSDANVAAKVERHARSGLIVIPVVEHLGTYDFTNPGIPVLESLNALGLNDPDRLLAHLLHHAGLAPVTTGGQVFISYARKDGSELATAVDRELQRAGFRSFIDVREIPGGARVQSEIVSAIRQSTLVVYVDSDLGARSRWVCDELDIARACHVPVLAVTPDGGHEHLFPAPHVAWTPGLAVDEVASRTASQARRILARRLAFEDRALRTLAHVARFRGWSLSRHHSPWTVRTPEPLRVACLPDEPTPSEVEELLQLAEPNRGLLVAGTRPYAPASVRAWAKLGAGRVRVTPLSRIASHVSDGVQSNPLAGRRVLLSAAAPDPSHSEHASHTLGPFVVVFIQTMVGLGATVVFGGHPSITPLVRQAVREAEAERMQAVELHQARYWLKRSALPVEAEDRAVFTEVRWHGAGDDPTADLRALREGMIRDLDAAVFVGGKLTTAIGGKPGILDEYESFRSSCPGKPVFVLGLAKGASEWLASEADLGDAWDPRLRHALATTTDPDLATALIVAGLLGP